MSAKTFDELMENAEAELLLGFQRAGTKQHRGLIGRSRENAVATFLEPRLPARFGVTSGEAIDSGDRRTSELDVIVFDRHLTAPLLKDKSADVLPVEALLAVIEVKSTLTKAELEKCAAAAKALTELRPYGQPFLPARREGAHADDNRHRCLYSVIAFKSDLSETDWLASEWQRVVAACTGEGVDRERIDRILVLDRGILIPPTATGRLTTDDGRGMLREWFLHMSSFVVREAARRPAFDFQAYARRSSNPGWTKLD